MSNKSTKRKAAPVVIKPAVCTFCTTKFPSKSKLFQHLNSGRCALAIAAGFKPKVTVCKFALYVGHSGDDNFIIILRHCLARTLSSLKLPVPWQENDPSTYKWTCTSRTKDIFAMERGVPRVEELISLALPNCDQDTLLRVLNDTLSSSQCSEMRAWRIVGPLPPNAHLNADIDCSKRRMEAVVPWSLFCPDISSPNESNLKPHSFHQFLMGFATCGGRTKVTSSSSPLSLIGSMSLSGKDVFTRLVYRFLCAPTSNQLSAMKRMKRTFQAFQGYRSFHNCTTHDGVLPQNSSVQQKIERFSVKGVVMVQEIGPCLVISFAVEKYFPIGSMRIILGLALAVYRNLLPAESIPIVLRNFSEKMKRKKEKGGKKGGKKSGKKAGKKAGKKGEQGGKKKDREANSKAEGKDEEDEDEEGEVAMEMEVDDDSNDDDDVHDSARYMNSNSYRRPIPMNKGAMNEIKEVSDDVGGSVILNLRGLILPPECIMLTECACSYWERKHRKSLITNDGTLQGIKVFDQRSGYRRKLIDRMGKWWSCQNRLSTFVQQFESQASLVLVDVLRMMSPGGNSVTVKSSGVSSSSETALLHTAFRSPLPKEYREVVRRLRLLRNSGRWPDTPNGRAKMIQKEMGGGRGVEVGGKVGKEVGSQEVAKGGSEDLEVVTAGLASPPPPPPPLTSPAIRKNGSFTIGFMPGVSMPPKANSLFPALLREIFKLEQVLMPNRPPSACCAVNCNAKFMPHKDSGAGNGQQISLIVGLGDYNGGQLGVEGVVHDIRYTPLEFDGWKQRHWTLPFSGERFSLVWFSPLGCGTSDTGLQVAAEAAEVAKVAKGAEETQGAAQGAAQGASKRKPTIQLRNGVQLPFMGVGTYQLKGEVCVQMIQHALSTFSATNSSSPLLIDTAEIYQNHLDIRRALKDVDRDRYFLVTKLSPKHMSSASDVVAAFNTSVEELCGSNSGSNSNSSSNSNSGGAVGNMLDGYLLHWVAPHGSSHENESKNKECRIQCWLALEKLYWSGSVQFIGVSNFTVKHLQQLIDDERVTVVPFVNQVEYHPLYQQHELEIFCKKNKIQIQAYASLAQQNLLHHSKVMELSQRCELSTAQLLLLWGMRHRELPIIPRTTSIDHMSENLGVVSIMMNETRAQAMDELDECALLAPQKAAWDSTNF